MRFLEGSLIYRAIWWTGGLVARFVKDSLIGRFFIALSHILIRSGGQSATFGLSRADSYVVSGPDHSFVVRLVSWLFDRLRAVFSATAEASRFAVHGSGLAGGAWIGVAGAGIAAMGLGRIALSLGLHPAQSDFVVSGGSVVIACSLLVIGLLVLFAERGLTAGFTDGLVMGTLARWSTSWVEGVPVIPSGRSAGVPRLTLVGRETPNRERGAFYWLIMAVVGLVGLAGGLLITSHLLVLIGVGLVVGLGVLALQKPEVVLLVAAAFPWMDWVARHTLGTYGRAGHNLFLGISVLLLVWSLTFLRRSQLRTIPVMIPMLVMFALAIGSVIANNVAGNVALFAMRLLFQPFIYYFVGFLFPKNKRWVQWAVGVFLLSSFVLALHGIYQYVTHAPMPYYWVDQTELSMYTRAYSIFGNPNGLGAFLLMGALISISLVLCTKLRTAQRLAAAVVGIVILGGVAVTFSRGAWLGLAAGAVVLMILGYRRYLAALLGAAVVGWFILPSKFTSRLSLAFSLSYWQKSETFGRLYVWRLAWDHAVQHPLFGVGLGTFGGTAATTFALSTLWVDSFYLQLAAEGGLILLAAFLWLLVRVAKGLVKSYTITPDPYIKALASGTFGGFVAVCAANLTASVWETLAVGAVFWFLAGMVTSAGLHLNRSGEAEE